MSHDYYSTFVHPARCSVLSFHKLQTMVKRYICKLKLNCSPANDGITAEHLLHGIDSNIPHQVANMLSLCIKYSVVPDIFTNGKLVPIPKKPGCDTSNPKNWRPIIISTTLSKMLELLYWKKVLIIISAIPNLDL